MKTPQNTHKMIKRHEGEVLAALLGLRLSQLYKALEEHYRHPAMGGDEYFQVVGGCARLMGDFFHNCLEMSVEDNLLVVRVDGDENFLQLPLSWSSKVMLRWLFEVFVNHARPSLYGIPSIKTQKNKCKQAQKESSSFSISSLPFGAAPSRSSSSSSAIKKPVKSLRNAPKGVKLGKKARVKLFFYFQFKTLKNKLLWLAKRKYKSLRQTLTALKSRFVSTQNVRTS